MNSTIQSLMAGAIDMHVHASHEVPTRRQNILEVAKDAAAAGRRAVVFKSKDTSTVDSTALANILVQGVKLYGGVTLDASVGGDQSPACLFCFGNRGQNGLDAQF